MTIQIELSPEAERRLREQAARTGDQPEVLASDMLTSLLVSVPTDASPRLDPVVDEHGVFHQDRWERVLASIDVCAHSAPSLPLEALSREALYDDHD
jgi:hypothetical protein